MSSVPQGGVKFLPAWLFQQKLDALENQRMQVALASELRLLFELAAAEISGLEEVMPAPSLKSVREDLEKMQALVTNFQNGLEWQRFSSPPGFDPNALPDEVALSRAKNVEEEVGGWKAFDAGWTQVRVLKHADTLSEFCFRIGGTLEWDEIGVIGVRIQKGIGGQWKSRLKFQPEAAAQSHGVC